MLRTQAYARVNFDVESSSYVYLIYFNCHGKIEKWYPYGSNGHKVLVYNDSDELASMSQGEKIPSKHTFFILEGRDNADTDIRWTPEMLFIIMSQEKMENFDLKFHELLKSGISHISHIFDDTTIRVVPLR